MPIPLRLRRRGDGTLALADANGALGPDREFPDPHLFVFTWLYGEGADVATVADGEVRLTLANASAVYRVVDNPDPTTANQGVLGEVVSADYFDPPPIDEAKAEARAAEVAAERHAKAVADARALLAAEEG